MNGLKDAQLSDAIATLAESRGRTRFSYQVVPTKCIIVSKIFAKVTVQAVNLRPTGAVRSAVADNISVMTNFRDAPIGGERSGSEIGHLTPAIPGVAIVRVRAMEGGPLLLVDVLITLTASPRYGQGPTCGSRVKPRESG